MRQRYLYKEFSSRYEFRGVVVKHTVSVVVPIYNVEQWLPMCIESILAQSFGDFELILVNDGSLDKSGELAENYAQSDERIKVIHKPNGGLSSARNAGIERAGGKYIAFVDSDDTISNDFLEVLYRTAEESSCDAVVCGYQTVPSNIRVAPTFVHNQTMTGKELILSAPQVHSSNDLCFSPRYFFNLGTMRKHNMHFNEQVLVAEDTIFNLEFLLRSERARCIPDCLYYYRINNPHSIMSTPYKPHLEKSLNRQYSIRKELSVQFGLMKHDHYKKDMADYYVKSIYRLLKNNLKNSPETDKKAGLSRILAYEMFRDSTRAIGFSYHCDNYREYIYYLAIKFKLFILLKKEF